MSWRRGKQMAEGTTDQRVQLFYERLLRLEEVLRLVKAQENIFDGRQVWIERRASDYPAEAAPHNPETLDLVGYLVAVYGAASDALDDVTLPGNRILPREIEDKAEEILSAIQREYDP
jgi:hypothetical protein